jgi:multidrug efflux pump subunit AcrA (membrane-fusion protein)
LNAVHNVAGTVVPVTQSEVAAQVSGIVKTLVHAAGDWVTAGETVIQLDDSQLQLALKNSQVALQNAKINLTVGEQNITYDTKKLTLQLQSAQSALAAAQKNYDALQSAYKLGTVSSSSVDTAQSQLQQAEATYESANTALEQNKNAESQSIAQLKLAVQTASNQLEQAQLNISNTSISAPFAGQIAVENVSPGEFVGQNTPAFLLVSSDRQISFSVPPTDAPILTIGKSLSFAIGGDTYKAQINQTPSNPVNGVVPLTAKLLGSATLPFGTVGTVAYPVTVSVGTLVPLSALQNDGAENYVFTIVQNKAHVQPITILGETGATAAVSQLAGGAEVVINPPPGLLEGASVSIAGAQGPGAPSGAAGSQSPGQGGRPGAAGQGGQGNAAPRQGSSQQSRGSRGGSAGGNSHAQSSAAALANRSLSNQGRNPASRTGA